MPRAAAACCWLHGMAGVQELLSRVSVYFETTTATTTCSESSGGFRFHLAFRSAWGNVNISSSSSHNRLCLCVLVCVSVCLCLCWVLPSPLTALSPTPCACRCPTAYPFFSLECAACLPNSRLASRIPIFFCSVFFPLFLFAFVTLPLIFRCSFVFHCPHRRSWLVVVVVGHL